jgi:hypothetical protein
MEAKQSNRCGDQEAIPLLCMLDGKLPCLAKRILVGHLLIAS